MYLFKNIHGFLLIFSLYFFSVTNANTQKNNEVIRVRVNELSKKVQVVLDMKSAPDFNSFSLDDPYRLVVDVEAKLLQKVKSMRFNRGVKNIRTGIRDNKITRVVIDLKKKYEWQVQFLPPDKRKPNYRIVIEVYDRGKLSYTSFNDNDLIHSDITLVSLEDEPINNTEKKNLDNNIQKKIKRELQEKKRKKAKALKLKKETKIKANKIAIKANYLKFIKEKDKYVTVIIDPGHGGYDSGALGTNKTLEKDIVLQIAKKIKQNIDATPNMRAKLIRSNDNYVKLRDRLNFAHKYVGDIMVSIHADAHEADYADGSSVYILSNQGATSEIAKILAESQSKEIEENSTVSVNQIENTIVKMQQDVTIENSYKLARSVLKHLKEVTELHKHTVERGDFAVLKAADIPSVLIETGFISNEEEEKKLKSRGYQIKLAKAIAKAIKSYALTNFSKKMKVK